MRILYNSLKLNGKIVIETAGINEKGSICTFEGSKKYWSGNKENLNRGGWNWFLISPEALKLMMIEAGFSNVETRWDGERLYAYGEKNKKVGICKAGLSIQDIL